MSTEAVVFNRNVRMECHLEVGDGLTVSGVTSIAELTQAQTDITNHTSDNTNPHGVTMDQVKNTTNKGDIIVDNGTNSTALGVGTDGQILVADSTSAEGLK